MDGWSNNSSYTSGTTSSGGWGNSGSSATSKGYGSSSSDYSSYSSDDSGYWSNQYGGASNSSSNSGSSNTNSAIGNLTQSAQSKRSAISGVNEQTDNATTSLTGQGLAGPVAAKNADYWSGPTDGWRANTSYTAGKAGQFGSTGENGANRANISAIKNKTATEGQIDTAKAQVAGWNTVNARDSVGGLLGFMGGTVAGPIGGYATGKAASFGAEKLSDYTSGFKDNPAYNESKRMADADSSIYGTLAGKFAPAGTGGMVKSAVNDATGTYRQEMADMQQALRESGHLGAPARSTFQQSSSSNSAPNSLLASMYQTQQPADTYNYDQPSLNYGNNATYDRGSVY